MTVTRRGRRFSAAWVGLIFILCAAQAKASDAEWRKRFEAEAPAAWEAYQQANRFAQGTCRRDSSETEWKCNETCRLARETNLTTGDAELLCQNPKYWFRLKRTAGRDWVLAELHSLGGPTNARAQELDKRITAYTYLMADPVVRLSADGQALAETIRSPRTTLRSVAPKDIGGVKVLEVQFDTSPDPKEERQLVGGVLLLDPNRDWLPISHTAKVRNKVGTGTHTFELTYGPGRFPPPARVQHQVEYVLEKQQEPWRHAGGSEYAFQVPARLPATAEFTLSAFGLPEPVGVTWPRPTPRYVWFLVAAGAFALLAVGLRAVARRKRSRAGEVV